MLSVEFFCTRRQKNCCTKLRSHVNFLLSGNEKPLKEIFLVEFTKKREKFRIA